MPSSFCDSSCIMCSSSRPPQELSTDLPLSCAEGNAAGHSSRCSFEQWVEGEKNPSLELLATSYLTPHVASLHRHQDVLLTCLPTCALLQSWSPANPVLHAQPACRSYPAGQSFPSSLPRNPFPHMLNPILHEPHFRQSRTTSLCR